MLDKKNINYDFTELVNLPPRKKVSATVWGAIFCTACAAGLTAGFVLVMVICDAVPVLFKHWLG